MRLRVSHVFNTLQTISSSGATSRAMMSSSTPTDIAMGFTVSSEHRPAKAAVAKTSVGMFASISVSSLHSAAVFLMKLALPAKPVLLRSSLVTDSMMRSPYLCFGNKEQQSRCRRCERGGGGSLFDVMVLIVYKV